MDSMTSSIIDELAKTNTPINIESYYGKIENILTLRYDPSGSTILPKLSWENFIEYPGLSSHCVGSLLEGAIRRTIEVNKPKRVGMGISGGVDSTTILSLTRKCFPNLDIKTFCITFGDDTKEAETALHVSELYSTDHKHIHIENPFTELPTQISIVDEPRWNLYPYFLFKEASRDCDLLLTGDGGDELFGGYVFRYNHIFANTTPSLVQRYLEAHNRDWVPDQEDLFAIAFSWDEIHTILSPYFNTPLPTLGEIFLADYNGKLLHDFTPVSACFSKHFGIRTIAPMLEPEVLYTATHIPYSLKYDRRNNLGKIILRQILIENFGHKPATQGKIGWGMDIVEMWDKHVKSMCHDAFSSSRIIDLKIINEEWLSKGLKEANAHNLRYISKMLGLLALELWLRWKAL
ncbi:MAG: asparagine synthase [Candidatus Bathyarchaeota archaeon]|nr:MAG: asparagine synthase [Candidatus Bathyarchaeota archaeon]